MDFLKNESSKNIVYDNVELIKPPLRAKLFQDLSERTGLAIHKVDVVSIDYLKDVAVLKAYYFSKENESITETFIDND